MQIRVLLPLIGLCAATCAAKPVPTPVPPKTLLFYSQPGPHVLLQPEAAAFESFAAVLWGDKSLLSEVCVARGKDGYVARAAGVVSADKAAVGELIDGKVTLYQNKTAQSAPAKKGG